jgi:hypothetical protein
MDMHTVISQSAYVARVNAFPAEDEGLTEAAETALVAHTSSKADAHTWHRRLAHRNVDAVMRMVRKGMVKGMEITGTSTLSTPCEPCLKGEQTRAEIHKSTETRADTVLAVCSPKSVASCIHTRTRRTNIL